MVFPAGLPGAQRFHEQARASGKHVIGASSLAFDPEAGAYDEWATLPYVHDAGFASALGDLVRERDITAIYTPHGVVNDVLMDLLPSIAPDVRLLEPDPVQAIEASYRQELAKAEAAGNQDWFDVPNTAPAMSPIERAGIMRLVNTIPGMTNLDKMDAVMAIMRSLPAGDIVEIGSWWGRSAALFLLLGRRSGGGPVLCIDPWRSDCLDQGVAVLDRASARLETDEAFAIFQMNLSPLAQGDLNYIRAQAAEAADIYAPGLTIKTEAFGSTRYSGQIALLHIDGNHAYEQVRSDCYLWTPHVRPGGWIIFDDYVWAFGDGPKRIGDEFLAANAHRIDVSFVMGTALILRLADQ